MPIPDLQVRDALYSLFVQSLENSKGIGAFLKDSGPLQPKSKEALTYFKDRVPRFVSVLRACRSLKKTKDTLEQDLRVGELLFNHGLFFDCHEHLEGAWKRAAGKQKIFLQGLIQAGAGFHKFELGSPQGAVELLGKAVEKLERAGEFRKIPLGPLVAHLRRSAETIERGKFDLDRAPKMRLR